MISLRIKLLVNSLSVLGLAAFACAAISYFGLTKMSNEFLGLTKDRSGVVRSSYIQISENNIAKIRSIYENGLTTKGKRLLSKDMSSLAPMIADNSFLGVQQFLQKTFEDDREITSATYFVAQGKDIKAWHFVSRDFPKGLVFPVIYDLGRKGWTGKTKTGSSVFVPDPNVAEIVSHNRELIQHQKGSDTNAEVSKIYFSIPFVEGKTGDAVKKAREKGEAIGFLRYVLSTEEMKKTISEETAKYQTRLASLQKGNDEALVASENLSKQTKEKVLFSLLLGTLLVTALGYLITFFTASRMTGPLLRLKDVTTDMARGNYQQDVKVETRDEIGLLAQDFQKMSEAIRKRDAELAEINKNLEKLVEIRTEQLRVENKKIAALLNNMKQAVFSVSSDYKVVPPVSLYSEHVFKGPIEGKSIFDFLYHQFERKSEAYSKLETSLTIVYGEDELQWMTTEDDLPKKLKLASSASSSAPTSSDQVLRVNYSPLYDDSGVLEKILFVVEDISDLERLEAQNIAQKAQLNILRQLTENGIEVIKGFFSSTADLISEVGQTLRSGTAAVSDFPMMLRNLHTVKGTSRTLGLDRVSSVVHEVENTFIEVKTHYDSPKKDEAAGATAAKVRLNAQELTNAEVELCRSALNRIKDVLGDYIEVAKNVYGLKNEFQLKAESEFHHTLTEIGWELAGKREAEKVSKLLENLIGLAGEIKEPNAENLSRKLLKDVQAGKVHPEDESWSKLILYSIGVVAKTGLFSQHTPVSSTWVGLAQSIWSVSESLLLLRTAEITHRKVSIDLRVGFLRTIEQAISYCELNSLAFFEGYFEMIDQVVRSYFEHGRTHSLDEALHFESEIWRQFLFTAQFHAGIKVSKAQSQKVSQGFKSLLEKRANSEAVLEEFSEIDYWLCLLSRVLSRTEGRFLRFSQRWAERLGIKESELYDACITVNPIWQEARAELKDELTFPQMDEGISVKEKGLEKRVQETSDLGSDLRRKVKALIWENLSDWDYSNNYLKLLDILELITGSIDNSQVLKDRYRIEEVLEFSIQKLKTFLLEKLSSLRSDVDRDIGPIMDAVDRLLEVPVKPAFWGYQKMLEDLSRRLEKRVKFVVQGDDVMMSRDALSVVQGGMVHILRNAIDHGIETEAERINLQKPPFGKLTINCFYRGGDVVISIEDDGRGINPETVSSIAVQKGYLDPVRAAALTDQEKIDLVLTSGFSTRDQVNELSGRGVGLDVAKVNVEALGGQLIVRSTLGLGCRFDLIIPVAGTVTSHIKETV